MKPPIDIRHYFAPIQPNNNEVTYKCYWQFKTTEPLTEGINHKIVADGCIDIFFELNYPKDNYVMGFSEKFIEFSFFVALNSKSDSNYISETKGVINGCIVKRKIGLPTPAVLIEGDNMDTAIASRTCRG